MNSPNSVFPLRFGVFELDARTGELRKQGLKVRLRRQAAKLLFLLLESPGKIRTREELQQRMWPESKFIDFDNSLNKAVHALRETLGDSASNPRFIEAVPGQGYRFIPILQHQPGTSKKIESVAVLPFVTESDEPDLAFMGNQITSGVINALSKIAGLHVLAHSSVKDYKPQHASPKIIGEDLRVDAVLVGELSRHTTDLFLNVEFVDATDGSQLWGAHLIENCQSVIDCSERVAREVLHQLRPILTPKQNRIAPISSKPRSLPIRKVSGNRI